MKMSSALYCNDDSAIDHPFQDRLYKDERAVGTGSQRTCHDQTALFRSSKSAPIIAFPRQNFERTDSFREKGSTIGLEEEVVSLKDHSFRTMPNLSRQHFQVSLTRQHPSSDGLTHEIDAPSITVLAAKAIVIRLNAIGPRRLRKLVTTHAPSGVVVLGFGHTDAVEGAMVGPLLRLEALPDGSFSAQTYRNVNGEFQDQSFIPHDTIPQINILLQFLCPLYVGITHQFV